MPQGSDASLFSALRFARSLSGLARATGLPIRALRKTLLGPGTPWRLRWRFDFRALGLRFVGVLSERSPEAYPFVLKVYPLEGLEKLFLVVALVDEQRVDALLDRLKPVTVVEALEYSFWTPDELLEKAGYGFSPLSYPGVMDLMDLPEEGGARVRPDKVDLAVISGKLTSPLATFRKAYESSRSLDPDLPRLTAQTLNRHVKKHVLPHWNGNYAYRYSDTEPVGVYLLEGWRSAPAARILVRLPGAHFALVDKNRAILVGQFSHEKRAALLSTLRELKVDMPPGELLCPPGSAKSYRWRFWRFIERRRWVDAGDAPLSAEDWFP
ncbi:hypothetical protein [Thermofilum pendens]|uniref:Uncharacterized protein n=1 Tax=Thermofilum pendens (strain DSM 2475 / Hrk 5) TaxID=368408 RepID=A1RZF2_THEPD|nr:hypothetical protein [Thermofilum pendens]ABL78582.1 hypothetical protein Tpen_1184 [Thermofilum pendens Hrk 5]